MVFENGLKNIQAAAYNGARTVDRFEFKNYLMLYLNCSPPNLLNPERKHLMTDNR
jgi:hypothetical protein